MRWVLSCYVVYSEVKEKAVKKKVPKKNGKKEKVNTNSKKEKSEKKELPKSLEIKENRVTSQNLINTDYKNSEKNFVQEVL